jgi:hypothetical protein
MKTSYIIVFAISILLSSCGGGGGGGSETKSRLKM